MTETTTTNRGGPGRGQGRKPISDTDRTVTVSLRLTTSQRAKLAALGGAAWVRESIETTIRQEKDMPEQISMESVAEGRSYWNAYRKLVGNDFSPTQSGLEVLSKSLGVSVDRIKSGIFDYLRRSRTCRDRQ